MPKFDPKTHHRRSIRLKGYDYSQTGAYFVTIVAYQRECLFGEVVEGEMVLNDFGQVVEKWWYQISVHFHNVETWAFVIMPNHAHGIIVIRDYGRGAVSAPDDDAQIEHAGGGTPPLRSNKPTLGQVDCIFQISIYKRNERIGWYGDNHQIMATQLLRSKIIRDEREMDRIHRYIESNPSNVVGRYENPANVKT